MVLPVTMRRTLFFSFIPTMFMYVSIIHTIVCSLEPTSGAGMSQSGPMLLPSAWVKRRVIRSSSSLLYFLASILMPPLAPPKGASTTAHL